LRQVKAPEKSMTSRLASRSYVAEPKGDRLLGNDRVPEIRSVAQLAGIASDFETQTIEGYRALARQMARRGHADTARTLLQMAADAEAHAAVHRPVGRPGGVGDRGDRSNDMLPPEFADLWDAARESSLLTPYRALALAVLHAQRAFVFYSYLAAHAQDEAAAEEAERLALAKLRHAAALRRWRRAAYRDEKIAVAPAESIDPDLLASWVSEAERKIAVCHSSVVHALELAGDEDSASLLRLGSLVPFAELSASETCLDSDCSGDDPIRLLAAAQKPLERLGERLQAALDRCADEAVYRLAQMHLERTMQRLEGIKRRLAELTRWEYARDARAPAAR
jgi:rubrerythrin